MHRYSIITIIMMTRSSRTELVKGVNNSMVVGTGQGNHMARDDVISGGCRSAIDVGARAV